MSAHRRLEAVASHLGSPPAQEECYILWAKRTPLTRSRKGGFKTTYTEELTAQLIEAALAENPTLPKETIDDVILGNVLQIGTGARAARQAQFMAGLPSEVPVRMVNRLCSSGLQAVADAHAMISIGQCDVVLAGGVETMTHDPFDTNPRHQSTAAQALPIAADCLLKDGITSENVATRFGVGRADQDEFALRSHQKASAAQKEGRFDEEIVPIKLASGDVVDKDDGIRHTTSLEKIASMKPAFTEDGASTAANCSQIADGAALCLLASKSAAQRLGIPPAARMVAFAVAGVDPDVMGIGPQYAVPKVLAKAGLSMSDIDLFEINEAFASQALHCARVLDIPDDKLNVNGGAIALGHPLGCTGARMVATLLPELRRRGGRYGVVSMCVGTGMGAAAVFERLG